MDVMRMDENGCEWMRMDENGCEGEGDVRGVSVLQTSAITQAAISLNFVPKGTPNESEQHTC